MKSQHEKNKEILMEEIEVLCSRPMTDAVATKLSAYHGALKAMCAAEKEWKEDAAATAASARTAKTGEDKKPAHTPELDGDTELERVFMEIKADKPHMMALFNILSDHMDQLSIVHRKMYDNLMSKFREVARN